MPQQHRSPTGDDTARSSHEGWLILDRSARPYIWYSDAIAPDEASALKMFNRCPKRRAALMTSGLTIRRGSGAELVAGWIDLMKATA